MTKEPYIYAEASYQTGEITSKNLHLSKELRRALTCTYFDIRKALLEAKEPYICHNGKRALRVSYKRGLRMSKNVHVYMY